MIADGGAEQRRGCAAQPAVRTEHQDLGGGLVDDGEGIAAIVTRRDDPAGELDDRVGNLLVDREQIDRSCGCGRDGLVGEGCGGDAERQRQCGGGCAYGI